MHTFIKKSEAFVAVGNDMPKVGSVYNCFILNVEHDKPVKFAKFTTGVVRHVTPQCNGVFRILTDTCTIFVLLKDCISSKIVKTTVPPDKLLTMKFHCDLLTDISFINDTPLLRWENHAIKNPISFIPFSKDFCMLVTNDMLYYGIIEHEQN